MKPKVWCTTEKDMVCLSLNLPNDVVTLTVEEALELSELLMTNAEVVAYHQIGYRDD